MTKDYFGEEAAARYDESTAGMEVEPVADFLAALAGDDPVLELGIGTGRIALPLVRHGVRVHGIDLSTAMVAKLREKPGGEERREESSVLSSPLDSPPRSSLRAVF